MPIKFRCTHCQKLLSVSEQKAGHDVKCPNCAERTRVPAAAAESSPPPPPKPVARSPVPPPVPQSEGLLNQLFDDDDDDDSPRPPRETAPARKTERGALLKRGGSTEPPVEDFDLPATPTEAVPRDIVRDAGTSLPTGESGNPKTPQSEVPQSQVEAPRRPAKVPAAGPSADEPEPEKFEVSRRRFPGDEMDLTPMVDVTFQLLIFFMITASFAMQKSIETPNQDPDQQGATQTVQNLEELKDSSIIVQISADNSITVDDEPVSSVAVLPELIRKLMREEQKGEMVIKSSSSAQYRTVVQTIDAANDAGIQRIRMAGGGGGGG